MVERRIIEIVFLKNAAPFPGKKFVRILRGQAEVVRLVPRRRAGVSAEPMNLESQHKRGPDKEHCRGRGTACRTLRFHVYYLRYKMRSAQSNALRG